MSEPCCEPPTLIETPAANWRTGVLSTCISILIGLILLSAAILKTHQLFIGRGITLYGVVHYQQFTPFLIEAELLLGLWLVMGIPTRIRSICAITSFFFFASVAAYETLHVLPSCGCFGNLKVPPAITAGFDIAAVAGLWLTRPRRGTIPPTDRNSRIRLTGGVALAIGMSGVLWSFYFFKVLPAAASIARSDNADSADIGGLTILEPADWLNKPFPLFDNIEGSNSLRHGHWLVVLYHHDCSTCREAIPLYEQFAAEPNSPRIAFVAMPPYAPSDDDPISPDFSGLRGKLSQDREWFATTPLVVALSNGIVRSAAEGEQAKEPNTVLAHIKEN